MKQIIKVFFPIGILVILWFGVSSPYFIRHKIPFPSTYLVSFFPPWNASYGMPVKNNAMPDVITQIYPWKKLTIDTWKNGSIPLWNPNSFSGTPHAANYQSAVFSPINLLFFILPFIDAWSIMILLQPLIAGVGMYLFLRLLDRSALASTIGAIGFMFCGFITTWMAYGTLGYAIAVLPFALWCISSDFRSQSVLPRLFLSLCIAFSFVSGHFQISVYTLAALISYIIFESISKKNWKQGCILFLYVLAGIMLAAPQLLLTMDAYSASTRATSFIKGEIIPWQYLVTLIAPDFFGNPVTRNDWFGHYAEWGSYIGVVPLVLAVTAVSHSIRGYKKYFIALGILAIALAYPTPLNVLLYKLRLPAISTSAASRIIVLLSFSLSALSAFGLDEIRDYWTKNSVKKYLVPISVLLVIVCLIWAGITVFKLIPAENLVIAQRNFLLPCVLLGIACIAILAGFIKYRKVRVIILLFLIALTAFDLYRYATKWLPFDPIEFMYPQVKSLTFLQSIAGENRVFGNIGNEAGNMFSLPLIEGYDAMYQGRYAQFLNATSRGSVKDGERSVVQFDKNGIYNIEALQLLGVRYIYHRISDGQNVWAFPYWDYLADSSMKSIYRDGQYEIFEFTKVFPRAFLASSYKVETENQKIIDTLFAKDTNRREMLVLEEKPSIEPTSGEGKADIILYKPDSVTIQTESVVPKLLFLSDTYDAGWKAFVDGKDTALYRADYDFRAVPVPAGVHTVIFMYQPKSFTWGIILNGIAVLFLCIGSIKFKHI